MYTKDVVALANPDSEELEDAIPMFELHEIRNMTNADYNGQPGTAQGDTNEIRLRHAFVLCSMADGYNSGRKYIMQARTEEECIAIIDDLKKISNLAIDKFLGKTQFCKMQALPAYLRAARASCRCYILTRYRLIGRAATAIISTISETVCCDRSKEHTVCVPLSYPSH